MLILSSNCCPLDASLQDIPNQDCPENIGQIQRLFLSKRGQIKFDLNDAAQNLPTTIQGAGNTPDAEAPWLVLFSAGDNTKVIKTPFTTGGGETSINSGGLVTQGGGDNTFFSGATKLTAINPSEGTIRFDNLKGNVIKVLRKLICHNELEMWFINQQNNIIGSKNDSNIFSGFLATNVVLDSMNNQGYGTFDSNTMTFQLPYNWDETKHFITPTGWSPLSA